MPLILPKCLRHIELAVSSIPKAFCEMTQAEHNLCFEPMKNLAGCVCLHKLPFAPKKRNQHELVVLDQP